MSTCDYVLIVDDQENNRLLVEDHLRKFNYDVHGVSSGEEALSLLSTISSARHLLIFTNFPGDFFALVLC